MDKKEEHRCPVGEPEDREYTACAMNTAKGSGRPSFLDPYFLGPYAENDGLLEKLLQQFVRDHVYWRRNFHPKDQPPIPTSAQYQPHYLEFVARLGQALHQLTADLKQAVPLFHPRYLGHMASDVLLPGLLAQMIATLYNPNNVSEAVAPVTVHHEIEAARLLARMFGMPATEADGAWGYLASGGTLANIASLRNSLAVKYYPLALAAAARATEQTYPSVGPQDQPLDAYTPWELVNLTIEQVIALRRTCLAQARARGSAELFHRFARRIRAERIETLGLAAFFERHGDVRPPVVLAPASAHYSWDKGMKLTGLGVAQLRKVNVDDHMRMDAGHLAQLLDAARAERRPVLQVVGVLGTTEYGTADPIDRILVERQRLLDDGLYFPVHVDAAWGGYLTSLFRNVDGSLVPRDELRKQFRYFPSDAVYGAFSSTGEADSITVDPHKLGYIPYPAGAYLCRHRGVIELVAQDAPYVFDVQHEPTQHDLLHNLGRYILEGSKPGSSAAAVYVTHQVLPLHREGFGRLMGQTIHGAEYFYDRLEELKERLADCARLYMPFPTDSNVLCFCVNPKGNRALAAANRFMRELFSAMTVQPGQPIQTLEYFASYTSIHQAELNERRTRRILGALDIDVVTLREVIDEPDTQADHLFLLRHTLMNPWLLFRDDAGKNTIDRYLAFLERRIRALAQADSWRAPCERPEVSGPSRQGVNQPV